MNFSVKTIILNFIKLIVGIFLFPIIFLIGVSSAIKQGLKTLKAGENARSWNKTVGEVSYKIDSSGKISFLYSYKVNDIEYQSNKKNLYKSIESHVNLDIDEYLLGDNVNVYYEPENPSNAVLEPQIEKSIVYIAIFSNIIAFTASFLLWIYLMFIFFFR